MNYNPELLWKSVDVIVVICWLLFGLPFFLRKRLPRAEKKKRDLNSWLGIIIVAAGIGIVWSFRRHEFTPFIRMNDTLDILAAVLAIILAMGSRAIVMVSIKTLGKQWNVEATLVEGHRLVTEGIYSYLRNPIYAGMIGMTIATGIAFSKIIPLAIGTLLAWYGTMLRIRSEENLLRSAFGESFDEYRRKVPALFPKLWGRG